MIAWRMATRVMGLASTLILVRLLVPADFGLVALGASFAQAIEGVSWIGVEEALVRARAPTRALYDTGFTLTIFRSCISGAVVLALAFPAGVFFGEPRLAWVLVALAVSTALDGFINIGTVDFRRDFAFDKDFYLWFVPRMLGTVATLAVAVTYRSYWALITGIVLTRLARVVLSYRMHAYRPSLGLGAWRELLGYSLWSWAVSTAVLLRERIDSIVIGRMLDPTRVGYFSVGAEIAALPTSELVQPLCRAAFSGFAAEQNAETNPGATYLRLIATMTLITLPAGMGISLVARPLVALAFGPAWADAAPLIEVLALAGTVTVIGNVSSTLLQARGEMGATLWIEIFVLVIRTLLLWALVARYGVFGGALGAAAAIVLEQAIYGALTFRRFGVRATALFAAVWRSVLATAVMAAGLVLLGLGWQDPAGPAWIVLAEGVTAGAGLYVAALLVFWFGAGCPEGAERDVIDLGRRRLGRFFTW